MKNGFVLNAWIKEKNKSSTQGRQIKMSNPNYIKGVAKERQLVNYAKSQGCIAFRSAGSHSPIDVVIIDQKKAIIRFIQCKTGKYSEKEKKRADEGFNPLRQPYQVFFETA